MRALVVRFLRWSKGQHWTVKVLVVAVVAVPGAILGKRWDSIVEEAFCSTRNK